MQKEGKIVFPQCFSNRHLLEADILPRFSKKSQFLASKSWRRHLSEHGCLLKILLYVK